MEKIKNVQKMNTNEELKNVVIDYKFKPKFATVKVVITENDDLYAVNGSDCYKINFIEELFWVICNVGGNQGWMMNDFKEFNLLIKLLYEKNFIGLLNEESAKVFGL